MPEYKVDSRRMLWTFISLKIVGLGKCYQFENDFLNKKADVNMVNVSPFHFNNCNIVLFSVYVPLHVSKSSSNNRPTPYL